MNLLSQSTMLLLTHLSRPRLTTPFHLPRYAPIIHHSQTRHHQSSSSDDTSSSTSAPSRFQNTNNNADQIYSALSSSGTLKVTTCTIRNLLNEMMLQHNLTPIPADALGRSTMCCLLASSGMQEEQMFQLSVKGDGALRGCTVIVNGKAEAKGFVGMPELNSESFTLQDAVGKGVLQVVKNHPDWPRPYNGVSEIKHSDIDRDFGIYLAVSEQRSCALAAATAFKGILCTAAGGYLVERLPDCPESDMEHVADNLAKLVKLDGGNALPTNLLLEGKTPYDIAELILDGLGMQPLNSVEPKALCHCSDDKLIRSLRLLPREDVDEILREEGKIEARCQFCGRVYRMSPEEVEKRMAEAKGDPSKDEDSGK